MLLAVLATVPFLAALGIAMVALQATVGGNQAKILAALRGESLPSIDVSRPVTVRFSPRPVRVSPTVAAPRWRAAA